MSTTTDAPAAEPSDLLGVPLAVGDQVAVYGVVQSVGTTSVNVRTSFGGGLGETLFLPHHTVVKTPHPNLTPTESASPANDAPAVL